MTAQQQPDDAGAAGRLKARIADSAWTPLVARVTAWGLGFLALAAVGSGAAAGIAPDAGAQLASVLGGAPARPLAGAATSPAEPHASPSLAPSTSPVPEPTTAPSITAAPDAGREDAGSANGASAAAITADGKVILNLAGEPELRRLPGIGAKKAAAILALRAKLGGRFKRPEDLLRVKGIGRKRLARLRPLLVVDAPPRPGPEGTAPGTELRRGAP